MTEHKNAAVLRAIADGKAVQWKANHTWYDYNPEEDGCSPLADDHIEWRVKTEPKPDVVRYVNAYAWSGYTNIEDAESMRNKNAAGMFTLVFDGETGKLKSVEIVE